MKISEFGPTQIRNKIVTSDLLFQVKKIKDSKTTRLRFENMYKHSLKQFEEAHLFQRVNR